MELPVHTLSVAAFIFNQQRLLLIHNPLSAGRFPVESSNRGNADLGFKTTSF